MFSKLFKTTDDVDQFLKEYYDDQVKRTKEKLKVDIALAQAEYEKARAEMHSKGNEQINDYEHTYHYGMQAKQVVLAKLDAEIEYKQELVKANEVSLKMLLDEKDKQIAFLSDLVKQFAAKKIEVELVK
jgi:hypothetical protein